MYVAVSRGVSSPCGLNNTCLWVARFVCKYKIVLDISTSAEHAQHHKIQNTSTSYPPLKNSYPTPRCQTSDQVNKSNPNK